MRAIRRRSGGCVANGLKRLVMVDRTDTSAVRIARPGDAVRRGPPARYAVRSESS